MFGDIISNNSMKLLNSIFTMKSTLCLILHKVTQ